MSVQSECQQFEVFIIDTSEKERIIPIFRQSDGTNILIAQNNQTFKVQVKSSPDDQTTYGGQLKIDGLAMQNYKTWKHKGNFFGIRNETKQGVYNQFKFKIPQVQSNIRQEITDDNCEEQFLNPFQNIIQVNIFNTKKVMTKKQFGVARDKKQVEKYEPSKIHADTKINNHPLSVDFGKIVQQQNIPDKFTHNYEGLDENKEKLYSYQTYSFSEDTPIQSINILYIDYHTAIRRNFIKMNNIDQVKYIPLKFYQLKNKQMMDKVVWIIIEDFYKKYFKPMQGSDIVKAFEKSTCRKLQDFGFENAEDFIKNFINNSDFITQRTTGTEEINYLHDQSKENLIQNYNYDEVEDIKRVIPARLISKGIFVKKSQGEKIRIRQQNKEAAKKAKEICDVKDENKDENNKKRKANSNFSDESDDDLQAPWNKKIILNGLQEVIDIMNNQTIINDY